MGLPSVPSPSPVAANPAGDSLARIAQVQAQAAQAGLTLRAPPPLPTTCCGRGCNGCVWEGYFDALTWWLEDAAEALEARPGLRAPARKA